MPYQIAIIGAGTAGLASAAFLARSGHKVTVYERFDTAKPVGAGLLLQPTGLSVLALLGLDQRIIESGSRIRRLYGKVAGSKTTTLDVRYASLSEHLFGVGIHRASLFSALHECAVQSGAKVVAASEIASVMQQNGKAIPVNQRGEKLGAYDLVIDASGAKSHLRKNHANVKLDKPYPFGAVWGVVKNSSGRFAPDILEQRYKHAYHMIGVLPVGKQSGESCLAFFWSMRVKDHAAWREQPLAHWQEYVASLWPETAELLQQFTSHDDLSFASYNDVILRKYMSDNIVFIGDSAHCTSPQLGQGANLALMDAMVLAACVNQPGSIGEALQRYSDIRRSHIRFYQMASRILTPFFQSDSFFFARLRFLTCGIACKLPLTQRIAAHVLCGTKNGLFTSLDPGKWAPDYALFRRYSNALIE